VPDRTFVHAVRLNLRPLRLGEEKKERRKKERKIDRNHRAKILHRATITNYKMKI